MNDEQRIAVGSGIGTDNSVYVVVDPMAHDPDVTGLPVIARTERHT